MSYTVYVQHANTQGFQPMSEAAYNACVKAGFNPITNKWN